MKKLIPMIMLIACGSAYAQMPSPDQILKENDKNGDGAITKEEAKGSMMEQFFDMMDSNKDGKITAAELQNMGAPGGGAGGPPPAG